MSETTCPHCDRPVAAPAGGERIVDCSHCGRSFALRPPENGVAGEGAEALEDPPWLAERRLEPAMLRASAPHTSPPTDVSLLLTGLAALGATVVFYVVVVEPLRATTFGQLFAARGWVPYLIALLTMWAAVILLLKYRLLRRQTRTLALDLLPLKISERITPRNAHVFSSYVRHVAKASGSHFLVDRLLRALQHFRARRSAPEVVDQLNTQAQADATAVESSYTMIRVFIWAVPILGFIGTVLGIGAAVSGFSESVAGAADLELMKQSIGAVTTGLGIAFDTTLLALVMSIGIMFPASSLQKAEEDFLARVEDYCDEHLVRRLDDASAQSLADPDRIARALVSLETLGDGAARSVERLQSRLASLTRTLGELEGRLPGVDRS